MLFDLFLPCDCVFYLAEALVINQFINLIFFRKAFVYPTLVFRYPSDKVVRYSRI